MVDAPAARNYALTIAKSLKKSLKNLSSLKDRLAVYGHPYGLFV